MGLASIAMLAAAIGASRQPISSDSPLAPPVNGPRRVDPGDGLFALVGATVHVKPGVTVERATLVVREGRIVSVEPDKAPPAGARVRRVDGLYVYPGFIEPYFEVEVPRTLLGPTGGGAHWNPRITPERSALDRNARGVDDASAETLRSMGFVAVGLAPRSGLIRGSGALISLVRASGDPSDVSPPVYGETTYQVLSMDAREPAGDDGSGGGRGGNRSALDDARWTSYPDSQMGAIALLRQTLSDAQWQADARDTGWFDGPVNALDALRPPTGESTSAQLPKTLLFDTDDELETLRALKIAGEFNRQSVILGSGREYRRLQAIAASKPRLIVPLIHPPRPRVATVGEADSVELRTLMEWEQAPTNLKRLDNAGLEVALTTSKTPDKLGGRSGFHERLSSAIKHGLRPDKALAMLTTAPAAMLGVSDQLGTLEPGRVASFIVTDAPMFTDVPDAPKRKDPGYLKPARIIDVWIDGHRHPVQPLINSGFDINGTWSVTINAPLAPAAGTTLELVSEDDSTLSLRAISQSPSGEKVTTTSKVRDWTIADDGRFSFAYDLLSPANTTMRVSGLLERVPAPGEGLRMTATVQQAGPAGVTDARFTASKPAPAKPAAAVPDAKTAFVATHESLAGTWTFVQRDGSIAKPDDAATPSLELKSDKSAIVKQAGVTYPITELKWDDTAAAPAASPGPTGKPATAKIAFRIVGLPPPAPAPTTVINVVITPTTDRNRLSVSISPDGAEAFQLARSVPTPETDDIKQIPSRLGLPLGPFAVLDMPEQRQVVITNAVVWTLGPAGTIQRGAVGIQKGKIAFVVPMDNLPELQGEWSRVDAQGRHLTPGIIDCHSHTGISKGVNEAGQAVTAEVRIRDVTDPDSISWYRQLAGGVTSVNSLHGSANPIGGQNCVIKNRWGAQAPDDLHFEGAIAGIKFALGENVKQSNWGPQNVTRYPQTRMGVESIIRDRFLAAREYAARWNASLAKQTPEQRDAALAPLPTSFRDALKSLAPASINAEPPPVTPPADNVPRELRPRRDLELEALAEILGATRLVHCHSYRQDEILMLARLAREFNFRIGTFQHILEGYKVADAVRDSAIGASAFSDWWNFKMEVQDAIPYAGPIMHDVGVVVSYNSDSDELARRLNVEAGKALKYGGPTMTPEDALKFVTLNPARQLKIDGRVGSVEVGKDADLVLWSGMPMSTMSRAERTYVDGRELFSLERDKQLLETNQRERSRLIAKILSQEAREKSVEPPGVTTDKVATPGTADKTDAAPAPASTPVPVPPKPAADDPDAPEFAVGRRVLRAEAVRNAADLRRMLFLELLKRGRDPRFSRMGDCGCELLDN
jgi:imidazolonepropionase-like amidohydrolase